MSDIFSFSSTSPSLVVFLLLTIEEMGIGQLENNEKEIGRKEGGATAGARTFRIVRNDRHYRHYEQVSGWILCTLLLNERSMKDGNSDQEMLKM
nr:hypothetical transcript [Hymenolepis microstoma]